MNQSKFEHVKIGARVKISYGRGYGHKFGKVYGRVNNEWINGLRIKLDDFSFETILGFTTEGIGAYLV